MPSESATNEERNRRLGLLSRLLQSSGRSINSDNNASSQPVQPNTALTVTEVDNEGTRNGLLPIRRPSSVHPTSGGTFMTRAQREPREGDVVFRATSMRESFSISDVRDAFRQFVGEGDFGYDEDFVDFVRGGCIEDELEIYRRKKAHMLLDRSPRPEPRSGMQRSQANETRASDVVIPATSVRGSYSIADVRNAYRQGLGEGEFGYDEDFVDFVRGGCIEDELDLYRAKKSHMFINNGEED